MLPPDDDYLEDGFGGADSAPNEAEFSAALALIPTDFYEQLAPLLQLCAVANFLLLGRPGDPVPRAIRQLTGFDVAAARRVSRLRNSAGLGRLLLEHPEQLYDYILLGQLTFGSPLLDAVRQLLPAPLGPEGEVADYLREFVVEFSEEILGNLTEYLSVSEAELGPDLRLRRLQLESIFARLEHTLMPVRLPVAERAAAGAGWTGAGPAPAQLRLCFSATQQAALLLALRLPEQLAQQPEATSHRFAGAVAARPTRHSAPALRHRLAALAPDEPLELTLAEQCLLYEMAQVGALVLVSGNFDELLQLPEPGWPEPTALCAELEQFVLFMQRAHPGNSELAAARREVELLAELL